jgi:hypothetical protein
MTPEHKKMWCDALRSGDYKQGKHRLCTQAVTLDSHPTYCCLGVLVEVYADDGDKSRMNMEDQESDSMPFDGWLEEHFKISSEQADAFARMNDTQERDFNYIADYIEKNL